MSRNGVIGSQGKIPWHLPEDFRWFKRTTMGHVVVMGRKTYESMGRPLPGRENVVLTRGAAIPGVHTIGDLSELSKLGEGKEVFVIGGSQLYEQLLPRCNELYLTLVDREVDGDAYFPPFHHLFEKQETLLTFPEFSVMRYTRRPAAS